MTQRDADRGGEKTEIILVAARGLPAQAAVMLLSPVVRLETNAWWKIMPADPR